MQCADKMYHCHRLGPMPARQREREDSGDEDELPTKVIIILLFSQKVLRKFRTLSLSNHNHESSLYVGSGW